MGVSEMLIDLDVQRTCGQSCRQGLTLHHALSPSSIHERTFPGLTLCARLWASNRHEQELLSTPKEQRVW